jgi:FtsH-binding integral membrane protein
MKSTIAYFVQRPERLWWIDGVGAMISAVSLGVVLPLVQPWIGMPTQTLYFLAIIPIFFALFDGFSWQQPSSKWPRRLKWIASANFSYCLLSLMMVAIHFPDLTVWGIAYFGGECLIVATLSVVEWKTANRLS